jgi:hypothetical protein
MPNKIKPKRSYTANSVPLTTDLETHELAINWTDAKAFTKNAAGNIVSVTLGGGGGGSGLTWSSVPASATASGTAGQIAYDGSYFYVASATNTWVRAALSTWTVPVITISSQPSAQTASSGAATFSVTASVSSGSVTYQWERQALGTGSYANVSGATSATLSLTGLTNSANNADNYRVVVSATGATSVTSNAAALTVASASLLSITRNNGTSTFTGAGTTASPFTRAASIALDAADGLSRYSWTANASATVTLVFSYRDDDSAGESYQIQRTRSGSTTTIHAGTDGTGISQVVSVISGDVIRFSSSGYPPAQFFSNVSVSAA